MRFESFQSCRSNDGWVPVEVESETTKSLDYTVMVCPWDSARECICECPGYMFQGHCRHQVIAHNSLCRWDSLTGTYYRERKVGPDAQTPQERKNKICPACGSPTKYELEVVEDAKEESGE